MVVIRIAVCPKIAVSFEVYKNHFVPSYHLEKAPSLGLESILLEEKVT